MATRECMHDDCPYPPLSGKRKCIWHDLLRKPIEEQIAAAEARRAAADYVIKDVDVEYPVARVKPALWPDGERWCSGCQGFVPLFYCSSSRCKAHAAAASHDSRIQAVYGIDRVDYAALLEIQGGRCYVCGQWPKTKRLAVDHDHQTGEVRGLLCADVERGCNHAVLGSIEARSVDGPIPALRRLIEYLEHTPYQRLKETRDAHDPAMPIPSPDHDVHGDVPAVAPERVPAGDGVPAGDPLRAAAPDW